LPQWVDRKKGKMKSDLNMKQFRMIRFSDYTIYILIGVLFLFFSLTTETFLSFNNIYALFYGVSIQFIAIIGFSILTILGETDLSVGAVYGLSGTIVGIIMQQFGWSFLPSMIFGLSLCTLFGIFSGFIVVKTKLNSMMVTLGTMTLLRGLNSILFGKLSATIFPASYRNLAKFRFFGIHWTILSLLIIVVVLEFFQKKTTIFKRFYYTGFGKVTAVVYGIKADLITVIGYGLCTFTAAFGGIVAASRITHSDINTGIGLELLFIAAVVVGGGSLDGGRGSILKAASGLLFLALLTNGMIIYKLDPFIQQVSIGVVLILSVMIDRYINRGAV
jgi:ribose transport system permease protein